MAAPNRELMHDAPMAAGRLLAEAIAGLAPSDLPEAVREKARGCLADFIGCAFEGADLPWSRCVLDYAALQPAGPAGVLGQPLRLGAPEAAFVNGALGHSLVREDMHVPSCSHLGVVVWPALLALAELEKDAAGDLLVAGVTGYEAGASVGRALFDAALAARIRPTGTVGPIAAAAGGARLLGLDTERTLAAIALAANFAGGLNEWPWAGGTEVVLHAGAAARAGVTAVLLARAGMEVSETAIEGRAGLFAAYGRQERAERIAPFADGSFAIAEVYWKPAPACNYVQTPCQVALDLVRQEVGAEFVESVEIASFTHALQYPGCDHPGPFAGVMEAKMSLQFSVAAVLFTGEIGEGNYHRLDHPDILRLARATRLSLEPRYEAAYPERQGARVTVTLRDGQRLTASADDVRAVDAAAVRARLEAGARERLGADGADRVLRALDRLGRGGSSADLLAATFPK